jgi:uncharacterized protein YjaZ
MIYSIYKDFFKFLNKKGNRWENYKKYYYNKYSDFLKKYWENFPDYFLENLKFRVEKIKKEDYSHLFSLLKNYNLEENIKIFLKKCQNFLKVPAPDIYLIIGFFSDDGFVIEYKNKPVIGFGLERFKDFKNFPIIFAHEYCHYARRLFYKTKDNIFEKIFSEGLSCYFSSLVFSEFPVYSHLFLTRKEYNSLREEEILSKLKNSQSLSQAEIYYIGYKIVKENFKENDFKKLIETEPSSIFPVF